MQTRKKLSDEIREAVAASELSRYRIAVELKIAQSTLSRFMNGKGGLTMENLDRLADLLGLHITVGPKRGPRKGAE